MQIKPFPTFSIIIPTYNYAHYLPRAIDSVLAQHGDDYELVVVDDGSGDETAEIVKEFVHKFPTKITYFFQENRGLSAARNRGASLSNGDYLLFLDADDALFPDAVENFRRVLQDHPHIDFIWAGRVYQALDGKVKRRFPSRLSQNREENFVRYVRGKLEKIHPGAWIAHKRVFDKIQFPETARISEDNVFNAHLLALFDGVSFPESVITIYRHQDSLGHNIDLLQRESLKTVDLLFDPGILPPRLMALRAEGCSQKCLAMFLVYYRAGHWQEAKDIYQRGIRTFPRNLFRFKHLRKYLWVLFRSMGKA